MDDLNSEPSQQPTSDPSESSPSQTPDTNPQTSQSSSLLAQLHEYRELQRHKINRDLTAPESQPSSHSQPETQTENPTEGRPLSQIVDDDSPFSSPSSTISTSPISQPPSASISRPSLPSTTSTSYEDFPSSFISDSPTDSPTFQREVEQDRWTDSAPRSSTTTTPTTPTTGSQDQQLNTESTSSVPPTRPESEPTPSPSSPTIPSSTSTSGTTPGGSENLYECNICLDASREPVITLCGHLFCWGCIYRWLQQQGGGGRCPVCHSVISQDKLIPIYGRDTPNVDPRTTNTAEIPSRPRGQRYDPPHMPMGPIPHFVSPPPVQSLAEQQQTALLSRLLFALGSFVILCLILF